MFNKYLISINKWRPLCFYQSYFFERCFSSFTTKDILYETSDEAGTLLTRFSKHIALERIKISEQVPTEVRYADYFPVTDLKYFQRQLQKTSADQLAAVIFYASTYRSNADPSKFASILNDIDRHATENVNNMNVDTILRTLYAFLFLIPNWITRLDFYGKSMQRIFELLNLEGCSTKEIFLQVSFYAGLAKKQLRFGFNELWKSFLDKNLITLLPHMSTLDFAIVSSALYKTSLIIECESFNQRLLKEVLETSSPHASSVGLFINFIKSMRLQRLKSLEVCEYLTEICKDISTLKGLEPKGQMHIFAYFADNLWDCDDCTKPLVQQFLKNVKSSGRTSFGQRVRGKDISTFLWCCAQLNCSLSDEQFHSLENSLLNKIDNKEFNYFPDQLVEACLSLWMLGFKSKQLLSASVQLKQNSPHKRHQPKVDSRLTVLLSAAHIEEPSWCSKDTKGFISFNLKSNVPAYLINGKDTPYMDIISKLNQEKSVLSATISNPINGINIPGVFAKLSEPDKSEMFVEFIASSQTLQFSHQPVAILRLKLRLLQSLGYTVKVIRPSDIRDAFDWKEVLLKDDDIKELNENRVKA